MVLCCWGFEENVSRETFFSSGERIAKQGPAPAPESGDRCGFGLLPQVSRRIPASAQLLQSGIQDSLGKSENGPCAQGRRAANFVSMCTLAIYFQATTIREFPVVIAANRDEFLDRPAGEPTTLLEKPHVVGGKDLKAGGTWLGISEYGIVAGLLNRRAGNGGNPDARSRGWLCLDAFGAGPRRKRRSSPPASAAPTTIHSTC